MKKLALASIKFYQNYISKHFPVTVCRFQPSCSVFTYQAIERYGIIKGSFLGMKRIIRCNPFSKGGYDPVK